MNKARWKNAVLSLVAVGVLAFILTQVDVHQIGAILKRSRADWLVACLIMMYGQFYLSAWRWKALLSDKGLYVPIARLVRSYLVGNFVSALLPSRYAGDVYRVYDVRKETGQGFDSAAAVFMERLTGLFTLMGLGFGAALWARDIVSAETRFALMGVYLLLFVAVGLLFSHAAFNVFDWFMRVLGVEKIRRIGAKFHNAVMHYRGRWKVLGRVSFFSLVFYGQAFFITYGAAEALGVSVPFVYVVQIVPIIFVLEALPISINGLGIREGAFTYFFTRIGVSTEEAFAVSLILLALRLAYTAVGGVFFIVERVRAAVEDAKEAAVQPEPVIVESAEGEAEETGDEKVAV